MDDTDRSEERQALLLASAHHLDDQLTILDYEYKWIRRALIFATALPAIAAATLISLAFISHIDSLSQFYWSIIVLLGAVAFGYAIQYVKFDIDLFSLTTTRARLQTAIQKAGGIPSSQNYIVH